MDNMILNQNIHFKCCFSVDATNSGSRESLSSTGSTHFLDHTLFQQPYPGLPDPSDQKKPN